MGRLKAMPGRLKASPPRLKPLPKVAEGFYSSPEWKAYRADHRARTIAVHGGVWCCVCGAGGRLILDHVVERKDGGPDFPPFDGAKWYCTAHHNAKTAKERAKRSVGRAG